MLRSFRQIPKRINEFKGRSCNAWEYKQCRATNIVNMETAAPSERSPLDIEIPELGGVIPKNTAVELKLDIRHRWTWQAGTGAKRANSGKIQWLKALKGA